MKNPIFAFWSLGLLACSSGQLRVTEDAPTLAKPASPWNDKESAKNGLSQKETNSGSDATNTMVPVPQKPTGPDYRSIEATQRLQMIQQIKLSGGGTEDGQIAQVLDFLIQDVCMDVNGRTTSEDPAFCTSRRNLSAGEALPYFKTDVGPEYPAHTKAGWQRSDSAPFQDKSGIWHIIKTFDFGGPLMPGKHWGVFEDFQDGFDVTELNGTFISYSGTKDGSNDNYWSGSRCSLNDGWILFPWSIARGMLGNTAHDIFLVPLRQVCSEEQKNSASAAWNWLSEKVIYTSNKGLETITTHHWSHPNSKDATSFELNYYTKEYGATRWEAWVKCSRNESCVPSAAANVCNGALTQVIHESMWKRTGCRDWTVISPTESAFPANWVELSKHRICLYGTGAFGDGKTCLN